MQVLRLRVCISRRYSVAGLSGIRFLSTSQDSVPPSTSSRGQATTPAPKLRAHNILAMKTTAVFAMPVDLTVAEAISNMVVHRITCALAVNADNEVEGIFTARDLLRFMHYGAKGKNSLSIGVPAFEPSTAIGSAPEGTQAQTSNSGSNGTGSSAPTGIDKMKDALAKPISNLITRREKMVWM